MSLCDVKAEESCIGVIMLNNKVVPELMDVTDYTEFSDPFLSACFKKACEMHDRGTPVDIVTLAAEAGSFSAERFARLRQLMTSSITSVNAVHHGRMVHGHARRRQLHRLGQECAAHAADITWEEAESAYQEMADRIMAQSANEGDGAWSTLHDAVIDTMGQVKQRFEDRQAGKDATWSLPMGLDCLNELTQGYQDGHLHIIGAKSGHGKTAFAVWSSSAAAERSKRITVYLTLEVDTRDTVMRLLASKARINSRGLRTGELTDGDIDRLLQSVNAMKVSNHMLLCYRPGATVEWLSQSLRRLKRSGVNIGLVVVDYIQKLRTKTRCSSREREVGYIAESLKDLAGILDVPMLGLVQLNRDDKGRGDKRPTVSDIRESSVIEQEASLIAFLHRPEMHGDQDEHKKGLAEFIVRKSRNAEPGAVRLLFRPEFGSFEAWQQPRGGY